MQVVEISGLTVHLLKECQNQNQFAECPRCGEAISAKDFHQHTIEMQCLRENLDILNLKFLGLLGFSECDLQSESTKMNNVYKIMKIFTIDFSNDWGIGGFLILKFLWELYRDML